MKNKARAKIVFLSTFPPTECGIATFSTDLIAAISKRFSNLEPVLCDLTSTPLLSKGEYKLDPQNKDDYIRVAQEINKDLNVKIVHVQHEYGLFGGTHGSYLIPFLETIKKPVAITFHSIIPDPDIKLKAFLQLLVSYATIVFIMTKKSQKILENDYQVDSKIITHIPHGTHIVNYTEPHEIKKKLNLENRIILSTFGLLGPGKSIETALNALPQIAEHTPNILYLIIGKTHPSTIKDGVDSYRDYLKKLVKMNNLSEHVHFVDRYLEIKELLDYLKATDIYLFTSKDPIQAVSGTFIYAMSCSCPIVASSIPHTREVLSSDTGFLIEIGNSGQLADTTKKLLENHDLRESMAINAFQKTRESSWENVSVKHIISYTESIEDFRDIKFRYPTVKLDHIKEMTTSIGIVQFCKISKPDISSGYTLDDNSRALIAMCLHYQIYRDHAVLNYISVYLDFIVRCQQASGSFINYIDEHNNEHIQNSYVNLEDSNARAVWALGNVISMRDQLPESLIKKATICLLKCSQWLPNLLSPRAVGFAIKGLYLYYGVTKEKRIVLTIEKLAKNLMTSYDINARKNWKWFENYMTYANSILPEAMLYAHLVTGQSAFKKVAIESFDFLLSKMFFNGHFKVISNNGWYHKDEVPNQFGEQPIDVSYTIQALDAFYKAFFREDYPEKMENAFNWFLGKNHLSQIMYNPLTGGCYDGLEKTHVNFNQGAESSLCYLIARLVLEQNRLLTQTGLKETIKKNSPLLKKYKRFLKFEEIFQNK